MRGLQQRKGPSLRNLSVWAIFCYGRFVIAGGFGPTGRLDTTVMLNVVSIENPSSSKVPPV
ncbi:MAG TPA: hypothetical protein VGK40_12725 [Verrucomicrobiae bacterium]